MATPKPQETGFLWVEEGEQHRQTIAEVALLAGFAAHTYTFAVPDALKANLRTGHRVQVPLGKRARSVDGFVVRLDERPWDTTLRAVESVLEPDPLLTPHLIELAHEIARHYACPLGRTLKAVLPQPVRLARGLRRVRYVSLKRPKAEILESTGRISKQRSAILEILSAADGPMAANELVEKAGVSAALIRTLSKDGWIEIIEQKEMPRSHEPSPELFEPEFSLTPEQQEALSAIEQRIKESAFSTTLLFGVSGSGKTEVYIQAMRRVLESGRQAILLVPEIVLTTQIAQRFASRFADVAVSHSGLTDAQRSIMWRQIASGEKRVVIGTRSAVFAPCPNLGLICVDEEQESGYKNLQAPRFHVRDVAIMRGKLLNIPVVLGSATPSLESWQNSATRPQWHRLRMPRRVGLRPMPIVHVIDMVDEQAELKRSVILSRTMERMLGETLEQNEQALILLNRRGYATRLQCPSCGSRIECPYCNVSLVVHASTGAMICHYCHRRSPVPTNCANPSCGAPLVRVGLGTQRIEQVLAARFPSARVQRVDSDTMTHRSHYQQIVDDFEQRNIHVLIGTQMIAKGLDFPAVSFVGVIDADPTALPGDFRAHERLFQLVTQVAGRAGRADCPGRVVVQTTMPELPALQWAVQHDFESFAEQELALRRKAGLPPFSRLARIVLAHPRDEIAARESRELAARIKTEMASLAIPGADVMGPSPCVLPRIRGKYRHELLLRTPNARSMRKLFEQLEGSHTLRTKAESTVVDVDPVTLS